jgi:hypothetical protein
LSSLTEKLTIEKDGYKGMQKWINCILPILLRAIDFQLAKLCVMLGDTQSSQFATGSWLADFSI